MTIKIEFDGGTPCNIPSRGYGIGYGSYRINGGEVVRLSHGRPMSANAAEILTLAAAVEKVSSQFKNEPRPIALEIRGDSQIALKWARGTTESGRPAKITKGTSEEFRSAIQRLQTALFGFDVTAMWQPRVHSVAAFGH